jgi:hypothetical protein
LSLALAGAASSAARSNREERRAVNEASLRRPSDEAIILGVLRACFVATYARIEYARLLETPLGVLPSEGFPVD